MPAVRRVPLVVGPPLGEPARTRSGAAELGRLGLELTATERTLLDVVGRHPFLTAEDLAAILGCQREWARRCRNRMAKLGLIRLVGPEEVAEEYRELARKLDLSELTPEGLRLLAAQQGVSLAVAERSNCLVGGGPQRPIGRRRELLRHLRHTVGVNEWFAALLRIAHARAMEGGDDALLEWRSAAACERGCVRPDGYGLYRRDGKLFGFFLEYDRGTTRRRDYVEKFHAYQEYLDSGRFARDYDGFPTLLIVTRNVASEARIVRAIGETAVAPVRRLSVLLAVEEQVRGPGKPIATLGAIWREAQGASADRRCWP